MDLVTEPIGETRAQGPVDQAGGEDGPLGGAALTPEETAGDLARGVHPLLDVDGQRKEVDALAGAPGCGRGDEHRGLADLGEHGAVGLLGEATGLEPEDGLADLALDGMNLGIWCHVCTSHE